MKTFPSRQAPARRIFAALAGVALFAVPAFAQDTKSEERTVEAFTKIVVNGAMEVNLTAGKSQKITVKTDEDRLAGVETTVKDGTLYLDTDSKLFKSDNSGVKVEINVKALEALIINGAIDGELENLEADHFELSIKGAADVTLDGTCGSFELDIRGAGDVDADDFKCEDVRVRVRGAGDAGVYASKSIDAHLMGVGNIEINGKPSDINKKVSGIGSITIDD